MGVLDPAGGSIADSDWESSTNFVDIGDEQVNACLFEAGGSGEDQENVYAITLAAGDVFEATVETDETDALVYLLSDCTGETCVANDPVSFSTADRKISFQADVAGTYYL